MSPSLGAEMAFLFLQSLFTLLSFLTFAFSSSAHTITLSISPIATTSQISPRERLNHLISASINRAQSLKNPEANASTIKTPLASNGYGEYAISLSFGTPPQTLPFAMDTASSLVWYPCSPNLTGSFPNKPATNVTTYDPDLSSSAKAVGCTNPICGWLTYPNVNDRCQGCKPNIEICNQRCPRYYYVNGVASSLGVLLSDTLTLPGVAMDDFIIGCSNTHSLWPAGVAGFGRGPASLAAQMGIKKFSYCLASDNESEDGPKTSELVLHTRPDTDQSDATLRYTPFHKTEEASFYLFREYYYLSLQNITVGGVEVKVPSAYLVPQPNGNGGLILDTSMTYTYMNKAVREMVSHELEMQMAKYARASEAENQWRLKPCFFVSSNNSLDFPDMTLHFEGGAEMKIPIMDYFPSNDDDDDEQQDVACMILVTSDTGEAENDIFGPSVALGSYQQRDLYLEFDLHNERLGVSEQTC